MSALSVSTSAIASPRAILSPGCLSQRRILPSSIVSESLGIVISLLIVLAQQLLGQLFRGLDDIAGAWQRRVLEMPVVGHRSVERGDSRDRRVERIERGFVNLRGDFRSGPSRAPTLVG